MTKAIALLYGLFCYHAESGTNYPLSGNTAVPEPRGVSLVLLVGLALFMMHRKSILGIQ